MNDNEFKKHIERINNQLRVVEDNVELKFPAMEYRFNRDLKNKVTMDQVDERIKLKADQAEIEALKERMDTLTE